MSVETIITEASRAVAEESSQEKIVTVMSLIIRALRTIDENPCIEGGV